MMLTERQRGEHPREGPLVDAFGRQHTYLRVSVTDRCNYRCTYCMPAEGMDWKPRQTLLSFEEIERIVRVMSRMGIRRVRLTGGEPLMRRGLHHLIGMLHSLGLDDLSMTTNAHMLAGQAQRLADAGLRRVNVSCDAIHAEVFTKMTRNGDVARVLDGIEAARAAGLTPIKVNMVLVRGANESQILPVIEHFAAHASDTEIRFIEYMPFEQGGMRHLDVQHVRDMIGAHYTLMHRGRGHGGPAEEWTIAETGQRIGFISPMTEHFCHTCNRLRLEADGHLRTCLSKDDTPSLRDLLRAGMTDADLDRAIRGMVWGKVAGHEAHLGQGALFEGNMSRIGG